MCSVQFLQKKKRKKKTRENILRKPVEIINHVKRVKRFVDCTKYTAGFTGNRGFKKHSLKEQKVKVKLYKN